MGDQDTVSVILQPYNNRAFVFAKSWIRSALPTSILASALQEDPTAASILIPNAVVSPDVMELLVELSQGQEPTKHNPQLLLAHRYLDIPQLLPYADPYYDLIPNRQDGNAPENQAFVRKLIPEDRFLPFVYLLGKGYIPTTQDFEEAVSLGATGIVGLLLRDPRIYPTRFALNEAATKGHAEIVKLLLADARVDPSEDHYPILFAAKHNHPYVLQLLLEDGRSNPGGIINDPIMSAASRGATAAVKLLLADPRVDPSAVDDLALRGASYQGHVDVIKLLLADPRVDPTAHDNDAIKSAYKNGHYDVVALLLGDERVRAKLGWMERLRYSLI